MKPPSNGACHGCILFLAGPAALGMPPASVLASLGLNSLSQMGAPILSTTASTPNAQTSILVAPGLPSLKKSLVDSIWAEEFIDMTELPPAKGKIPALSTHLEGQVVLMQMSDYVHSKRLIPDFGTGVQCFMTYTAVLLAKHPGRATSLLLYAGNIAQLSQRWRWPSWVVYDNAFRKRAADKGEKDWSELDGGLHAQCFNTGMALNAEGWCKWCHSMDHLSTHCPFKPPASKRPAYQPPTSTPTHPTAWGELTAQSAASITKANGENARSGQSASTNMCAAGVVLNTRQPFAHWPHASPRASSGLKNNRPLPPDNLIFNQAVFLIPIVSLPCS